MTIKEFDFIIYQGETLTVIFNYVDSNRVPTPLPNLPMARMQLRKQYNSNSTLLSAITDSSGKLVVDTVNNKIILTLSASDTQAINSPGVWDIEMYEPLDLTQVVRVFSGKAALSPEVTR